MERFGQFLVDNHNILPPTGLPLSPENEGLRNPFSDELRTFRVAYDFANAEN
jgi:hypothetical protein